MIMSTNIVVISHLYFTFWCTKGKPGLKLQKMQVLGSQNLSCSPVKEHRYNCWNWKILKICF